MKGKSKKDYEIVFGQLNENIKKFLDINEDYFIEELHTDVEIQIGEACRMIYPNVQIKYCIWHMKRALINKINSLCKNDIENDDNILILYNMINNLYLCHPDYVKIVFYKIKDKSDNENFDKFLKYFEDYYIKMYNIKNWNYFNNFRHITNNACESYNAKINNLFQKKPTYFKLIYELRLEEADIIINYKKRNLGLLGSNNRRSNKMEIFLKTMQEKIEEIINLPNNNNNDRKKIELAWYNSVKSLGTGL